MSLKKIILSIIICLFFSSLSAEENLIEASHNFYNYLNILDLTECSGIAVAPIPNHDLGKTINDRLKRASHKDE